MWLTLDSNDKTKVYNDDEVFEEMLDREERDVMPESGGMHY